MGNNTMNLVIFLVEKRIFKKTIRRDEWKSRYYKEHNLKLIEIPYSDYEILDWEYLQKKGVTSEKRLI